MSLPAAALGEAQPLSVIFGGIQRLAANEARRVRVGAPCLDGVAAEEIFPAATHLRSEGSLQLFQAGELLLGHASVPTAGDSLDLQTRNLYGQILAAARGRPLYRIWNYVPRINEQTGGLEHYRAFCRGRSEAFEQAWGHQYKNALPAASAVGCDDAQLVCVFVAGRTAPRHVENPEQIPAYEYPQEHGPRAPSFSRATIAQADDRQYVFISGTAAIKGHATVAPGALDQQIACTLDNLKLISRASGIGERLGGGEGWTRHFKVYLRHAGDLAHAREQLGNTLLHPTDRVTWLRSDICRAALNIEIEATLVR